MSCDHFASLFTARFSELFDVATERLSEHFRVQTLELVKHFLKHKLLR